MVNLQHGGPGRNRRPYLLSGASLATLAFLIAFAITGQKVSLSQSATSRAPAPEPQTLIHSLKGKDLFLAYCASCHGTDAQGHGPVASELKSKVPDLTVIRAHNNGVFPRARVGDVIVGDNRPPAHGSRQMPVWGPFFSQVEEDVDYGKVRVENLVHYLESIQNPQAAPAK